MGNRCCWPLRSLVLLVVIAAVACSGGEGGPQISGGDSSGGGDGAGLEQSGPGPGEELSSPDAGDWPDGGAGETRLPDGDRPDPDDAADGGPVPDGNGPGDGAGPGDGGEPGDGMGSDGESAEDLVVPPDLPQIADLDSDQVPDDSDNCPAVYNPDQSDLDQDGAGDLCDEDMDGDNFPNLADNCPYFNNPGQEDMDEDGIGDPCDDDNDNDGVPDAKDEQPFNPNWPGLAWQGTIYAHTSATLYTWNPETGTVATIGNFGWPQGYDTMTDIAVDYEGHLLGVSFSRLYRCSAVNAECLFLANLPESYNGMTIVPVGTVSPDSETVIGIGNSGSWNKIELQGNLAVITNLGSYGVGYSSAGDAYSIEGIGTYAAVNKSGAGSNWLVKVNPVNGAVLSEVGELTGYGSVYGLAGDGTIAYAFDAGGAILKLDVESGLFSVALPSVQGKAWWGAGVTTRNFTNAP